MVRRFDNVGGVLRQRQNGVYIFHSDYQKLATLARSLAEETERYCEHPLTADECNHCLKARAILKELGEVEHETK